MSILQSYVLRWYHTFLLHPWMDITEATIVQNLYWTVIKDSDHKEVPDCDTYQLTKQSNIKYGELSANESDVIPRNKLWVDLIIGYVIIRKGNKDNLNLKKMIIYPVTWWIWNNAIWRKNIDINRKLTRNYVVN